MRSLNNLRTVQQKALIALFIGAAAISFSPIFVRLSELGPSATGFYRITFALPVLWVWMSLSNPAKGQRKNPSTNGEYFLLILAGLFFSCDLAVWHWSISLTSVANSTLLANAAPIFVTLGAFLFFGERFSTLFLFGLVGAVTGIFLLMSNSYGLDQRHFVGDILGVVTAMFYAAYILVVGKLRSEFSTATVMTWSGGISCLILIPVTILSGESFIATSLYGWLILLLLALLSQAGGQSLIAYSLAHVPVGLGSVGLLLQPVLAAMIAWFLFGEVLHNLQLIGGMIVLIGIYLARKGA